MHVISFHLPVILPTGSTGGDGKGLGEVRECANGVVLKLGHFPVAQSILVESCRNIRRHHEI